MVSRTVLVTGANGYIGREVCLQFRNAGWTVYGVCRTKEKFAKAFLSQEEIIPVITDYKKVEDLFPFVKNAEVIIECATTTATQEIMELMINLLKQSGKCSDGTKKLFIQTTGFMQYQFEPFVLEQKDIITAVVQPAFIFGKSGGIVFEYLLFKKPAAGDKLNIAGNKDKLWGWCHVTDLAKFYVLAAQKKAEISGQAYKVGKLIPSCTYEKLLKEIAQCMGVDVKYDGQVEGYEAMLKDLHMPEFDNKNSLALGWEPKLSCDPIQEMKVHYDSFLAWQNSK